MEAQAINRYVSTSPRKMRLVIDLIRGKSVNEALHILHFSPKHAARTAERVLRSAVSNLQNRDEAGRLLFENELFRRNFESDQLQPPAAPRLPKLLLGATTGVSPNMSRIAWASIRS